MGHPMAKNGIRKRGERFIKHQDRRYDRETENFDNFESEKEDSEEDYDTKEIS